MLSLPPCISLREPVDGFVVLLALGMQAVQPGTARQGSLGAAGAAGAAGCSVVGAAGG
jgi:hypothetical protein